MVSWWIGLLAGMGAGLILTFIIIPIRQFIRNHSERNRVKRLIENKEFLVPIDERDYDKEKWKDKIDLDKQKEDLKTLDKKIFEKKSE